MKDAKIYYRYFYNIYNNAYAGTTITSTKRGVFTSDYKVQNSGGTSLSLFTSLGIGQQKVYEDRQSIMKILI